MNPQEPSPHVRRRPHPFRWLLLIAAALAILIGLLFELWPRFVGTLLRRDDRWAFDGREAAWQEHRIVWDPGAREAAPPANEAPAAATPPKEETPVQVLPELPPPVAQSPQTAAGGESLEAAGSPPGAGQGGTAGLSEKRRSPRILSQAWARQDLLESLDESGLFGFRLRVEADGRVSSWEVTERFDCSVCLEEAERIIRSLRFAPGTVNGQSVACWVPYRIEFRGGKKP